MRKFCISDIHGQYKAFIDVLKKAKFKLGEDHLYILGDLIDWGDDSIKVIKTIMRWEQKYPGTIFVTIGNHDLMMLSALKEREKWDYEGTYYDTYTLRVWFDNCGEMTLFNYLKLKKDEQDKIFNWLNNLKVYL